MPSVRSLLGSASLLLLAVAACTPAAPPATTPSTGGAAQPSKPAVEQKAVFGFSNMVDTLDAHGSVGLNGRRYDLYDCLVLPNEKGEPQPAVATTWKLVDDLTWEFKIRTDMKWHDGAALTAEDIKYSYDRALNPDNKLAIASRIPTIASTSVTDASTVVIKTKTADPILLRRLGSVGLVPKAYVEKVGPAEFASKPVGSGPYKLKSYKPLDTIVLEAFSEHAFRKPILKEITIRQIPEESARVAGLQTGELDYINLISADQAARLKGPEVEVVNFNAGTSVGFFMDTVRGDAPVTGALADKRVRQAINYAIDRETISKQLFGGFAKPEAQMAQPETFGFNPNLKPYAYDPKKAKELLAAAGYANGFTMKGEASPTVGPEFRQLPLLVQQYLKDIGITIEFALIGDPALQREKFYGTKPREDLLGIPLSNRPAMDAEFALNWFWSKQTGGTRHYANAEFDKYYEASRSEMDSKKRLEALQKAMEVMYDDPPFLFIVAGASLDLYSSKRLKGAAPWVERDPRFDKIEKIG